MNMRKVIALVALGSTSLLLQSCISGIMTRPVGAVYANVSDPVEATSAVGTRTGEATSTSYLGCVAVGDSSIEAAKKNGGISTVSSVDVKRTNILGVITKYTTVVKGH